MAKLERVSKIIRDRLHLLEVRAAKFGNSTPPEVSMEIEDLRPLKELVNQIQNFRSAGMDDTQLRARFAAAAKDADLDIQIDAEDYPIAPDEEQ